MFYNLALEYYKYTHLGLISKDPEGFGNLRGLFSNARKMELIILTVYFLESQAENPRISALKGC